MAPFSIWRQIFKGHKIAAPNRGAKNSFGAKKSGAKWPFGARIYFGASVLAPKMIFGAKKSKIGAKNWSLRAMALLPLLAPPWRQLAPIIGANWRYRQLAMCTNQKFVLRSLIGANWRQWRNFANFRPVFKN